MRRWSIAALGALIVALAALTIYWRSVTPPEVARYYALRAAADIGVIIGAVWPAPPAGPDVGPYREPPGIVPVVGDTLRIGRGNRAIEIVAESNGHLNPDHATMHYADPRRDELSQLRERFALDSLVAGRSSDFERTLALAEWVGERFPVGLHGRSYSPEYDVAVMLADAEARGGSDGPAGGGFQCDELVAAFIQAASSVGIVARSVSVQRMAGDGHAFAEVWVDDERRWVAYDLLFDRYYVDAHDSAGNTPVSALYLKRMRDGGFASAIDAVVRTDTGRVVVDGGFSIAAPYLGSMLFNMRPNYVARRGVPAWMPEANHVAADVLWAGSSPVEAIRAHRVTDDSSFVYWPLNETRVAIDTTGQPDDIGSLTLRFGTETPAFDGFVIRQGGGEPVTVRGDSWLWRLPDSGSQRVTIASRNIPGRLGHATHIVVRIASEAR